MRDRMGLEEAYSIPSIELIPPHLYGVSQNYPNLSHGARVLLIKPRANTKMYISVE